MPKQGRRWPGDTRGEPPKRWRPTQADLLQLIATLNQRFAEPDFPVHSFPELSLEAWTFTSAIGPDPSDPDEEALPSEDTVSVEPQPIVPPVAARPYGLGNIVADGCFLPPERLDAILQRWIDKKT